MGLKSVLGERFHDFGDKTSIAGLNNAVHSKSNGKELMPSLFEHTLQNALPNVDFFFHLFWLRSVKLPIFYNNCLNSG